MSATKNVVKATIKATGHKTERYTFLSPIGTTKSRAAKWMRTNRPLDVDVQGPVHNFVGRFVEDPGQVDPGVVEDNIQAVPARDGRVRVGLNERWVGHIGHDGKRVRANAPGRFRDAVGGHIDAGDAGALLGEPDRRGSPNSRAGPGHDTNLARQTISHSKSSL